MKFNLASFSFANVAKTILGISALVNLALAQASTKGNAFTAPVAGDTLTAGEPFTIKWMNIVGNTVTLELVVTRGSSDLSVVYTIASLIPNAGSFTWNVPASGIDSNDGYSIRIRYDANPNDYNYSDRFTFVGGASVGASSSVSSVEAPPTLIPPPPPGGAESTGIITSGSSTVTSSTSEVESSPTGTEQTVKSTVPNVTAPAPTRSLETSTRPGPSDSSTITSSGQTTSTSSSTSSNSSSSSSSKPIGAIVGGVIGGLAVIVIGLFAVWLIIRQVKKGKNEPTSSRDGGVGGGVAMSNLAGDNSGVNNNKPHEQPIWSGDKSYAWNPRTEPRDVTGGYPAQNF